MRRFCAGPYEFQILAVGNFVFTDRERGNGHPVLIEFIVPAEFAGLLPESCLTGWNRRSSSRTTLQSAVTRIRSRRDFLIVRQIVEKIGQRFGMHQAMLQRHIHDLLGSLLQHLIDDSPRALVVLLDLTLGRPIGRLVLRSLAHRRIDSEFEKPIEFRMEGRNIQRLPADLVPVERFQMSQIENQPVPFRDGPRIQSARPQALEQLVGTRARQFNLPKKPSAYR